MQITTRRRPARSLNLPVFVGAAVIAMLMSTAACEEGKKAVKKKQDEVAEKVGGAPKRQIDAVTNRVNASIKKGVDRLGENSGVEIK